MVWEASMRGRAFSVQYRKPRFRPVNPFTPLIRAPSALATLTCHPYEKIPAILQVCSDSRRFAMQKYLAYPTRYAAEIRIEGNQEIVTSTLPITARNLLLSPHFFYTWRLGRDRVFINPEIDVLLLSTWEIPTFLGRLSGQLPKNIQL